jgi:hypothetical protein
MEFVPWALLIEASLPMILLIELGTINMLFGLLVILGIVAAIALCVLADRSLLWMERKGWISYRTLNPSLTARRAITSLQEIVQPEIRDIEEEKRQRAAAKRDKSKASEM